MPRVQFDDFKINLNSVLLMAQIAGLLIYVGVQWNGTGSDNKANATAITRLEKSVEETRTELREQRAQATATAVLKADMENLKLSLTRIERTLEARLK